MSYNIQEAVEDWVLSLSQNEVDKCLSQLEMKRQGTLFRNQDKLSQTSKWDVHALDVVLKSEQILEILQKTTAEAALRTTDTQYPDITADGDDNNEP